MLQTNLLRAVLRAVPLAIAFAVTGCATGAAKEPRPDPRAGYLQSGTGEIVRDSAGQCIRSSAWSAGMNVAGCSNIGK